MRASVLALVLGIAVPAPAWAAEAVARIRVQQSPLAGLRYYDGAVVWDGMRAGDALTLAREPDNPHDSAAVRIEWRGRMIGYVPRRENAQLARQMDLGAAASGRIVEMIRHRNGKRRLSYEILVPLHPVTGDR